MPHDASDPIPVACAIVTASQTMVTRRISVFDPAVVTIAKIAAGTTNNIIPETAEMLGTIRTLSPERRAMVARELKRLAPAITEAHGCTAEVAVEEGFRSEEHTSELQSLMRHSYSVFCLKKKTHMY